MPIKNSHVILPSNFLSYPVFLILSAVTGNWPFSWSSEPTPWCWYFLKLVVIQLVRELLENLKVHQHVQKKLCPELVTTYFSEVSVTIILPSMPVIFHVASSLMVSHPNICMHFYAIHHTSNLFSFNYLTISCMKNKYSGLILT